MTDSPRGRVTVRDESAALRAGAGCSKTGAGGASCPFAGEVIEISLRDGDDSVTVRTTGAIVDAGPGADRLVGDGGDVEIDYGYTQPVSVTLDGLPNDGAAGERDNVSGDIAFVGGGSADDTLVGGAAPIKLNGGAGNDSLAAGAGPAELLGGDGDDQLRGGPAGDTLAGGEGSDAMTGGDGEDTASYSSHATGVTVTFGGGRDDGSTGEGDDVSADIENAIGGRGEDLLMGDDRANKLHGFEGSDTLAGGAGHDELTAGSGGRTRLDAGAGRDLLRPNALSRVFAADGETDLIRCARSAPRIEADALDTARACAPPMFVHECCFRRRVTDGRLRLRLFCSGPSAVACQGRLRLKRHGAVVGQGQFGPIPVGGSAHIAVRLRRAIRLPVRLRIETTTSRLAPPSTTRSRAYVSVRSLRRARGPTPRK